MSGHVIYSGGKKKIQINNTFLPTMLELLSVLRKNVSKQCKWRYYYFLSNCSAFVIVHCLNFRLTIILLYLPFTRFQIQHDQFAVRIMNADF